MSLGIGERICITTTQINELYVIVDAGEKDVVWLQVEMNNLVGMQIPHYLQQLPNEFLSILLIFEIVWVLVDSVCQRLPVDIFHEDAIVGE